MKPAEIPSLVLALSGILVLAAIVLLHRAGRPLLRAVERPFRAPPRGMLLLLAAGLFLLYSAVTALVSSRKHTVAGDAAAIAVPLAAAVLTGLVARRVVMVPRGSFAWRIGMGLLHVWAVLPVVFGTYFVCKILGSEQDEVGVLKQRGEGWRWLALSAVLVAPVVEEVCFRGLLYPALRQRFTVRGAIALSSVAFALIHPPTVWLPLAILAAVLAWLVETTGSVMPSIAAHMAFNGLTVATVLLG